MFPAGVFCPLVTVSAPGAAGAEGTALCVGADMEAVPAAPAYSPGNAPAAAPLWSAAD